MSTVARAATKCSLNVAMARSVALTQWLCGGTSWMFILLASMCFSTAFVHHIQCWLVVTSTEYQEHFGEGGYELGVRARWLWLHDDCIKVVDVCDKDILHVLE